MKTAGMAFTKGLFGTLGVGVAVAGTVGVVVLVGERMLKKLVSDFEKYMKAQTEAVLGHEPE